MEPPAPPAETRITPHRRVQDLNSNMRSHTPQDGDRPGSRRSSLTSRSRPVVSALPRPQTSLRESRVSSFRSSQPTYNPLTGTESNPQRPPSRPSSRQSYAAESIRPGSRESSKENMAPPDADEYEKYRKEIEALKADIGTLQYRMQTADQEKEIALSQQNNKVEQARRREQEETQQRQTAETERAKAASEVETVRGEIEEFKEVMERDKKALERKVRDAQEQTRLLQEEVDDLSSAKEEAVRIADRKNTDLQMRVTALEGTIQELEEQGQTTESSLQQKQAQLSGKDDQIAHLEADILRLKAQSGDAETMEIIKTELSEQVQHIRALESSNRDQLSELKHLREVNRAVEVVEEEKRSLQRRVMAAELIEAELSETRMQRQRLEDERLAWTAYLQNATEAGVFEFDSPEAMARALVEERLNTASYVEKLGASQAENTAQQNTIRSLEEETRLLKDQVEEAKASANAATVDKARLRLDRQRVLALKEVEYLRAQLQTFNTEEESADSDKFDQARAVRIQELEAVVDNYKAELQALHTELSSLEKPTGNGSPLPVAGAKRSRPDDDRTDEQLGQLTRKNRKLQEEMSSLQTQITLLEKDLSASRDQLTAAKQQSKTRVLSLRANPTSNFEAIKTATLEALKKENEELLATLQSKTSNRSVPLIPLSTLDKKDRDVAEALAQKASAQKSARRLKEVWGSKSQEFKEAIFSTLGWTVTFMPNGKMRVESTFLPSQSDEHENSIMFDGERGTMKVGGGPKSAFARRISDQIGFWVREKGCIPGFLAALTLEFYEEHSRTSRAEG